LFKLANVLTEFEQLFEYAYLTLASVASQDGDPKQRPPRAIQSKLDSALAVRTGPVSLKAS